MEKTKARASSLKPHEDAEFQHACVVKGGPNHSQSKTIKTDDAGKSPIIILQSQQSILLWLEVRLRRLEDARQEETRQELVGYVLLPSLF